MRAYFEYEIENHKGVNIIAIIDLNTGMSVTNDAENVCEYISKEAGIDLNNYKILYKDSDGYLDGIKYNGVGRDVSFYPIREKDFFKAKNIVVAIN